MEEMHALEVSETAVLLEVLVLEYLAGVPMDGMYL